MHVTCRRGRSGFVRSASVTLVVTLALSGALPGGVAPLVVHATDVTPPPPAIVGFVDTHVHQFANLAFGGAELWGSPMDPALDVNATPDAARRRALPSSDFIYLDSTQVADYLGAVGVPVTPRLPRLR